MPYENGEYMRLTKVSIEHYRSIGHVEIHMPKNRPLVLFGANNAGKSNIISAIHRALGEQYPATQDLEDSDFFMRDREAYPDIDIRCDFDEPYYRGRSYVILHYNAEPSNSQIQDEFGNKMFLKKEERAKIQSFVVDAEREIGRQLSYYSKYSLLSKFAYAIHKALAEEDKASLTKSFEDIKGTFEALPKYHEFFESFHGVLEESVKGFVHDLKADFSAYDPNNLAKSMRIVAYEGGSARSFGEFGTGEQQVLLMAFAKAYVETFGAESLILIIEEPEAHLHPLAQRWLKEYIYQICSEGLQVILSTHSADFLDMSNLDGLVRVTKDANGVTSTRQVTAEELARHCHELGAPRDKVTPDSVLRFYGSRLFPDEAKGFFASKVLIVEGPTEYFALPELFNKLGHSLVKEGVEIVNVRGKTSIPHYWRLFSAFGIDCCCIFDGDVKKEGGKAANDALGLLTGIDVSSVLDEMTEDGDAHISSNVAFFSKDFERFMRAKSSVYREKERLWREEYGVTSKPELARATSRALDAKDIPSELEQIWEEVVACAASDAKRTAEMTTQLDGRFFDDCEVPF